MDLSQFNASIENNIITVDGSNVVELLKYLRDDSALLYKQLVDVCGVDYPQREKRFEVVYQLLSLHKNTRITVKVNVAEGENVPTVEGVFSSANWFEREIFDMYGVEFDNHSDMRRILTDYGFEGHPQRKDFPLTGYKEVRYDENQKKVIYDDVKLDQAYRDFDYSSPWEGTEYVLPGDEKAK